MPKIIAAIDVGTNSFHLLIVQLDNSSSLKFRVIEHIREAVRLGAGSSDMKSISEPAIQRAIDALRRFKKIADSYDAPVRAIGTSAVREALNQKQFIAQVDKATGITIEVVSGFEEARFIYLGVLQRLPVYNKKILLLHIGGGSSEILIGQRRAILYDNCIKLGTIRLTDRFFADGKFRLTAIEKCRNYVRGMLAPIKRAVEHEGFEIAIGSSGIIIAIAQRALAADANKTTIGNKLNGIHLSRKNILAAIETIIASHSAKTLAKLPGIDQERADILVGGAILLEQFLLKFGVKELLLSEGSLKEGVVFDSIEKMHSPQNHRHFNNLRQRSVENLAETFAVETKHAVHTAYLTLRLFDEMKRLGLAQANEAFTDANRELLHYAAYLHDIGFFLSHAQHHRHSWYLIRNAELLGFTEHEKSVMANIARYHRKSHPKPKHAEFMELDSDGQNTVLRLAPLLRIADGLDRSHNGIVTDVHCSLQQKTIVCTVMSRADADLSLELWGAEQKKGMFEEVYGKTLILKSSKV
jgi:exopolyphosphatase / guanosine-5'-triphosphate,3'-diphosphate pyrophosphatase